MFTKRFWIFVLVGFLIFGKSLFNSFVWDDEEQVINNLLVHSLSNLPSFFTGSTFNTGGAGGLAGMYYKPMMSVCFAFLYSTFNGNPFFFHLFQVIIHILNTYLVYRLFKHFMKINIAYFLSLIFLVHPINTEAVVYVAALQDTLYQFFGLLSFNLVLSIKNTSLTAKRSLIIALFILLALLSKETGILFTLVISVYLLFYKVHLLKYWFFIVIRCRHSLCNNAFWYRWYWAPPFWSFTDFNDYSFRKVDKYARNFVLLLENLFLSNKFGNCSALDSPNS